jgi:hypothetical protein
MRLAYTDYNKYCEKESYNELSHKTLRLRLISVVNKLSTTKNKIHYRYCLIKESVENKIQQY